jgi:large subunit ribosomal protein L25
MNVIQAKLRDVTLKAKQLRRSGFVPCVIYGAGLEESLSVQIPFCEARQLRKAKRLGSLVDVQVEGKRYHTLIKEIEYNSIKNEIIHISFQSLEKGKKANSVADIVLLNKDKVQGVLEQIQMQVPHAAEPEYLLDTVTVDLEGCPIGTVITVGDIPEFQSDNIELQIDSNSIVLRISEKKRAVEVLSDLSDPTE